MRAGASAGHTFTQPGTHTYLCSIHPFMHGTVVVTAAAAPAAPSPRSAAPAARSAPTHASAATPRPALPHTGVDPTPFAVAGGLFAAAGTLLRRRLR